MNNLKLRLYPDPFLNRKSKLIKKVKDKHIRTSIRMHELMLKHNGLGLAAPQVGVDYSVIVINTLKFDKSNGVKRTMFNPEIIEMSEDLFEYNEGCLSFPDQFINIKRPELIVVKYINTKNETVIEEFKGITSICAQHEIDHVLGILFIDKNNNK